MEDEAGSGVLSEASGTDYATGKFLLFHFIPIMLCVGVVYLRIDGRNSYCIFF